MRTVKISDRAYMLLHDLKPEGWTLSRFIIAKVTPPRPSEFEMRRQKHLKACGYLLDDICGSCWAKGIVWRLELIDYVAYCNEHMEAKGMTLESVRHYFELAGLPEKMFGCPSCYEPDTMSKRSLYNKIWNIREQEKMEAHQPADQGQEVQAGKN